MPSASLSPSYLRTTKGSSDNVAAFPISVQAGAHLAFSDRNFFLLIIVVVAASAEHSNVILHWPLFSGRSLFIYFM